MIPLLILTVNPAYAIVTSLTIEKDVYATGDNIVFIGTESEGKKMVSVVLYNPNGKFVNMLGDSSSELDGSFETFPKLVKNLFTTTGRYNATGFTDKISEGITLFLNYDGEKVSLTQNFVLELVKIGNKSVTEKQTLSFTASATDSSLKDLTFKLDKNPPTGAAIDPKTGVFSWIPTEAQGPGTYLFDVVVVKGALEDRETITVTVNNVLDTPPPSTSEPEPTTSDPKPTTSDPKPTTSDPKPTTKIPDFVDPKKGAQYYLDRYNNEPAYKKWFDTNYPDYTIDEAIELAIPGSISEPEPPKNIAPFVDAKQDPQYYVDRYNNEPSYKAWFDKSFPDQTIYEAVGVEPPKTGICGTGTTFVKGVCVTDKKGGGCLIATAAYGSEMSQQVQFLREMRDNTVLGTDSGSSFMGTFNSIYYSFSPTIADWERESPIFKNGVRVAITPLLTSLSILNTVDIDSEEEMLGYGIGIILLNLGMYLVGPAFAVVTVRKYLIK
jgi:hypothetical protein